MPPPPPVSGHIALVQTQPGQPPIAMAMGPPRMAIGPPMPGIVSMVKPFILDKIVRMPTHIG